MRAKMRQKLIFGIRMNIKDTDEVEDDQQDEYSKLNQNDSQSTNQYEPQLLVKKKPNKKSFIDYIIISENSKWKATFDIYITFLVAYSCFTTVYYVAFDDIPTQTLEIVNYIVEGSFFLDFSFNFLTEYTDPDTYQKVR